MPEFLIYLPTHKVFATFYMNSKTARREAPIVRGILEKGKACTLKVNFIKTKKFSWHGPIATQCSTPLQGPGEKSLLEVLQTFNNPPESELEVADDTSDRDR